MKQQKARRFRLIPLTMSMLGLMLVIQINELYNDSLKLRAFYGVREATAEEAKDAKPTDVKADAKADPKADAKPADAKDAKADAAPADGDAKDAPKDAAATDKPADDKDKKDDKKDEKKDDKDKKDKPPEEPKTFGTGKSTIKQIEALKAKENTPLYSKSELDVLENLSKRRDELDAREKDLEIKSKVLDATQNRIDDKMAEMKALEAQLSKVVALYNEKQNTQISSLVKIYETMKPTQAAAIFNELDMPILLEVIDKMSSRKVAPVLALMDPRKAKEVTEQLAAMRRNATKPVAGAAK